MSATNMELILILNTTLYRAGGSKFTRAARTLAVEKRQQYPEIAIWQKVIESKTEFLEIIESVRAKNLVIKELHFLGHSGMYGIMFGSSKWPEQFSPYEWRIMKIPFAPDAQAHFHACRTARWFARFFSQTFQVTAFGYTWYTSFSKSKERFKPELRPVDECEPLYVVCCPGRKSHGLVGSMLKYSGQVSLLPMSEFSPSKIVTDASYNPVADAYDEVFEDFSVRQDEWKWLINIIHTVKPKRLLDIGCGNGAFLAGVSLAIEQGAGVDASERLVEKARVRWTERSNLSFHHINSPSLPFPDNSFDMITSVLSFRYLDWDPIIQEMLRVLSPGGRIIILDMVHAPVRLSEMGLLLRDKVVQSVQDLVNQRFSKRLKRMVQSQSWQQMLQHNPIRSQHEFKWYLESRFPGRKTELLNVGWNARILGFDSGPVSFKTVQKLTYP